MSTARERLVVEARKWIGEHFDLLETSEPVAWENAVRAFFRLPTEHDAVEIKITDFHPQAYTMANMIFREILHIAVQVDAGELDGDVNDYRICHAAWSSVRDAPLQKDLTTAQRKQASLTAMIDGLQFYATYIPGGLFDATRDIAAATDADFESLLGGT